MTKEKIILAYSGGLDTSVAIKWLIDLDYEVIACCLDVGEGRNLDFIKEKALTIGAAKSYTIDARDEFANEFALIALQAHAYYEGKYPLISALSRPLIAKKLVDIARTEGATSIAHGCTGKGNDQVRFEVAIHALAPDLKIVAPVRDWKWSREEEINYARQKDIPIQVQLDNPFSIDQNLWGRSNECGILENPWISPPEEAYELTTSLENTPDSPEYLEINFKKGIPTTLNNKEMPLAILISKLNHIAGHHGIGRIDHIENRLVGIKSREVYECPAAQVLITAHKELEDLTLVRETLHFKPLIEQKMSEMIYNGLWFSPLTEALISFLKATQTYVNGTVRIKLFKGHAIVEGRKSPNSLYDENLATYTAADTFDQEAAIGFIKLWGLQTKVNAEVNSKNITKNEV